MPEPKLSGRRYIPALDGLRAVAVIAVVCFHLGFGWAQGGLLGVGVFFTLSGYLITDILIVQYGATGRLHLRTFWLHRARRLLPAVIVMLVVVTAWVTLLHRSQLPPLRGAVVAALGYVSNWWLVGQHVSYFAQFGPPSPLGHLWSLAIEEQFYLIWPWLLLLGIRLFDAHRNTARPRYRLAAITIGLAAVSALEMALLYHPALDLNRVYDGTDTRAFGLLIGAALAMLWPSLRAKNTPRTRTVLDVAGTVGLVGIAVMVCQINEYSAFLYRGGLVLLSIATAAVVAAVVCPGSRLGRGLGVRPLRWIGERSYSIYLWHFPIFVLTNPGGILTFHALRSGLQVAATIAVAALSWRFLEEPIRAGALGALWTRRRTLNWGSLRRGWRAVAFTTATVLLATACLGLSTPTTHRASLLNAHQASATARNNARGPVGPSTSPTSGPARLPVPASTDAATTNMTAPTASATSAPAATTTACSSVVHIGDSTSEGMVSPDFLPDPAQRLDAQFARVGITTRDIEVNGGTSVLETVHPGDQNAREVAQAIVNKGYRGCWVIALGTNDTADVYVGSVLSRAGRVDQMMSVVGGTQPVIWLTTKTLRTSGPYSETNMQLWNQALLAGCAKYPNMRVFDWASLVQNSWFQSDQIHFTSVGYAQRASMIANSLVHAFPGPVGTSPTSGCTVT